MDEKGSKSEDHTMMIYKVLREILVDRESALEIARILLRARYGADELARQEPLKPELPTRTSAMIACNASIAAGFTR